MSFSHTGLCESETEIALLIARVLRSSYRSSFHACRDGIYGINQSTYRE